MIKLGLYCSNKCPFKLAKKIPSEVHLDRGITNVSYYTFNCLLINSNFYGYTSYFYNSKTEALC